MDPTVILGIFCGRDIAPQYHDNRKQERQSYEIPLNL